MSETLKDSFNKQRRAAKYRGIQFLLTFEEWLNVWVNSGHLYERGKRANQYCMARHGDIGPYAVDNVKIITIAENTFEANLGRKKTPEQIEQQRIQGKKNWENPDFRAKCQFKFGRKLSNEHKAKIRASSIGKKMSAEAKEKMSRSKKKRWSNNDNVTNL